jgi:hypothetical protein
MRPSTLAGRPPCQISRPFSPMCGTPAKLKFQVNAKASPDAEKYRMSKQCKPADRTPCILKAMGTEMGDPVRVKITW